MISYRKLAMRVLGHSPVSAVKTARRSTGKRAAALALTAALVVGMTLPAFADTWFIEDGNISISAGESGNHVEQGDKKQDETTETIITNRESTASSNSVTIEAGAGKTVNVTLNNVNIDTSETWKAAVSVIGKGNTNIELNGNNTLTSGDGYAGLEHNKKTDSEGKETSGTLTITDDKGDAGKLTATGGNQSAGIGGGSGNDGQVTITGGEITANGGKYGAGIGGGDVGNGTVTITGGDITANGGDHGAGIGGGLRAGGRDITISKDSQLKAAGGAGDSWDGCGAAIGNGGYNHWGYEPVDGSEKEPDTSGLYTTGKVERKRGDGTVLDTIIGTVEPPKSASAEEEPDKREPLYRVLNLDGSSLKYQAQKADGVLALTAKADGAILTGTLRALGYLQNQGIEKITFTDGTHTATIVLADLIAKGEAEAVYVLTLGAANTLTLNGEAIDF